MKRSRASVFGLVAVSWIGSACGGSASDAEAVCATAGTASDPPRVHMSFIFDISSSMGNRAERFELKWQPVVAATEAFFAQPRGAGLSASLTFFPINDNQRRCNPESYEQPDVPQTLLPSPAFAGAIDALGLTPSPFGWGNSTPTLAAFEGVAHRVALHAEQTPREIQSIVLVTDGVPENCGDDRNDIQLVADAIAASSITTYVVGVSNLPDDRVADNLDNLHRFAAARGTGQAFLIDTGDPAQTRAELGSAIESIQGMIGRDADARVPIDLARSCASAGS